MLPTIWIIDTYSVCLLIGVMACLYVFNTYAKKIKMDNKISSAIEILGIVVIIIGLISAVLFQSLFDALKGDTTNNFAAMTFFGGLVGGVISFILIYFLYLKKKYPESKFLDILKIAPACITIAHGFGRIGCFMAGCCYGIQTTSWLGVTFPGMTYKVYPTQLFEAFFLFFLSACLFILAFKFDFKYTFTVYLASYGIFRFMIEFIRGDDRGAYFLSLSPSQWFSIVSIIIAIVLPFIYFKVYNNKNIEA